MSFDSHETTSFVSNNQWTLLIGESGNLIREALKCWLERIPSIKKVYAVANSSECLKVATHFSPALAILPLQFDQESGVQVAVELKKLFTELKIAFWINDVTDLLLCEILACKPVGLLSIRDKPEQISETIEQILSGTSTHSCLLEKQVQRVQNHLSSSRKSRDIIGLTPRQKEVLRYLAQGHTVKEVASKMHLSSKSIDSHKYRIMNKLNIHDRVHLTRFAIREGLLEA